jgi:plastocyanin
VTQKVCTHDILRLFSTLLLGILLINCAEAAKLRLSVQPGLKYDPIAFHVQPGEKVELLFDNVDEMMHNFVLVEPGSRMRVVESAIALGADGPNRHYVPETEDVIASTLVVLPGKKTTVTFVSPEKEGEYPYVCTFPGHGFVMFGTLFVAKARPAKMDELIAKAKNAAKNENTSNLGQSQSGFAVVHRTFMPDSSPAAIAVALPGGHSYCWDAGACRLRYAWRDGFIKKNGSFGRWRTLPTIEGRVYLRERNFPFHFNSQTEKKPKTNFLGYRMIDGIPQFRYEFGEAEFTELIVKLPGKSGLLRKFTVKNSHEDLLFHLPTDAGVKTTCNKGKIEKGMLRLTSAESKRFSIKQSEILGKAPVFYLSMNDLVASNNRRGILHPGVIGQAWQLSGGKKITPAQPDGDFSSGAGVSAWVKLTDPKRSISSLVSWGKGGNIQYSPSEKAFSFHSTRLKIDDPGNGLEAENAKFKGPKKESRNSGHHGSGYLDFGFQVGQFVEWKVRIEKDGEHRLRFRYSSYDSRPLQLSINGEVDLLTPTLPFEGTGDWTTWKHEEVKRKFTSGEYRVRLTSVKKTGPNIDSLEIIPPGLKQNSKSKVPTKDESTDEPIIDGEWHHLALSLDQTSVRIYLDGNLHKKRDRRPDEELPVGNVSIASKASHPKFLLDELSVYERPLKPEEIKRLSQLAAASVK